MNSWEIKVWGNIKTLIYWEDFMCQTVSNTHIKPHNYTKSLQ